MTAGIDGTSAVADAAHRAAPAFPRLEAGDIPVSAKGRRTRDRLLTAARTVFERDGFLEARVADIADEAGVAHGTFYTYFDSKPEIFRTVVADVMEQIWYTRASTDGDTDISPYEAIERANRQFIRVYREHGAMLGLMEQAITYDAELRNLRLMVRKRSVERVQRSIERMQADGIVRTDVDPQVASAALVSMVSNFVYFWLVLNEGDYDDKKAVNILTKLWASALEMQRPEPGSVPRDDTPATP
jgi:AcrR family transcriptional regulator